MTNQQFKERMASLEARLGVILDARRRNQGRETVEGLGDAVQTCRRLQREAADLRRAIDAEPRAPAPAPAQQGDAIQRFLRSGRPYCYSAAMTTRPAPAAKRQRGELIEPVRGVLFGRTLN